MDRPIFKINKSCIITSWSYIMDKNTECTICRKSLNSNSIYADEKGFNSILSKGLCGHMYHKECIDIWLNTNTKCPICSNIF